MERVISVSKKQRPQRQTLNAQTQITLHALTKISYVRQDTIARKELQHHKFAKQVNLATHLEQDQLTIALIAPLDFTVQIRIQELFVMADTSALPKLVTRLLTPQQRALSLKMDLNLKLTALRVPIKT